MGTSLGRWKKAASGAALLALCAPVLAQDSGPEVPAPEPPAVTGAPAAQDPAVAVEVPAQEPVAEPAPRAADSPYLFLEDRNALLAEWTKSGLVERLELGTSAGGRELFGVAFGAPGPVPLAERATVLLVGGLDGRSLSGSQAVLSVVSALLSDKAHLPVDAAFLAVPWANPDGLARWRSRAYGGGRNDRGIDDDGDGLVDEDGPDDLDRDGLILEMLLEDPTGPWVRSEDSRFLRPAKEGEAPRYVLLREGMDDDGDGAFNEDGPGGVLVDHNFNIGWEDCLGPESGPWPLSEPESSALANLALHRRTAVVIAFQGNHGMLATPGGRIGARSFKLPLTEDEPTYRRLTEVFCSHTARLQERAETLAEAREQAWPGSLVDWSYAALGSLSMEIGVWGPFVQTSGRGPVDAYFKNPAGELGSTGISSVEQAWARWLDDTRGGIGFTDWQPIEMAGGRDAWIGGWEPNTRFDPPIDILPQALRGMDAFVLDLARNLPRLEIDLVEAKREGRVCLIKARVKNLGTLPSGVGPESGSGALHLRLEIAPGVTLHAGELESNLGHLPGRGSTDPQGWLLTAPEGSLFRIVVESAWSPPTVREVRL